MPEIMDFNPEEISDISVEDLLDSLTLGVMKNNISLQIKGKVSSQQNFLSVVTEKFDVIESHVEDSDIKREIQYEIIDFCRSLILEIVDFYNLFYDDDFGESKKVIEILSVLYNFFVLRGEEIVTSFFINYIQANTQRLLTEIDISNEVEDVTTISNGKKNINQKNIQLLSNLDAVINFIASNYISPEEFFQYVNDGDFYIESLERYFEDNLVTGDFINQYIMQYVDDYSSEKSMNLRNNIRINFMN